MPLIQNNASIPANATTPNLLSGSIYEYLPFDAYIEVAMVSAVANALRGQVVSGSDVLMEDGLLSGANRVPVYPDDFNLQDYAAAGDRLVLRVQNTTAGAVTVLYAVKITPV